jgi:hypothetical protein
MPYQIYGSSRFVENLTAKAANVRSAVRVFTGEAGVTFALF